MIDDKVVNIIFSKIRTIGNLQIAINSSINKWIEGRGHYSQDEKARESFIILLATASRIADNKADNHEYIVRARGRYLAKNTK